jgi:hypothetical protein
MDCDCCLYPITQELATKNEKEKRKKKNLYLKFQETQWRQKDRSLMRKIT